MSTQNHRSTGESLRALNRDLVECRACPRLVAWRQQVASDKTARFRDDDYWGRPVPGFGDRSASIVLLGLAPAAHGANRTGRMFTGDRSGDWLFEALAAVGLAEQATSVAVGDGQRLHDVYITSVVHCAPPGNKPTPAERDACGRWVATELSILAPSVVVCLGAYAYDQALRLYRAAGAPVPVPKPKFAHGLEMTVAGVTLLCSYHPSQHNTFTGRLTQAMLQQVLRRAMAVAGVDPVR